MHCTGSQAQTELALVMSEGKRVGVTERHTIRLIQQPVFRPTAIACVKWGWMTPDFCHDMDCTVLPAQCYSRPGAPPFPIKISLKGECDPPGPRPTKGREAAGPSRLLTRR